MGADEEEDDGGLTPAQDEDDAQRPSEPLESASALVNRGYWVKMRERRAGFLSGSPCKEAFFMRKKQFKAESKRLLDLMINSIYTHKEIFLRELISNASDAIDKLCYLSLTDDKVGLRREDFAITLIPDEEAGTLTVRDNGIGMDQEELENNLGVIARSGTLQFRQETQGSEQAADVIGQFGVGFYSAFMVSDHITVVTRKYGSDTACRWESDGVDGYTVEPCEKETVGTDIILHIKKDPEDEPGEYSQYLQEYALKSLVKKYSDYIRFPIRMEVTHSRRKEGSPDDKPEYEDVREWETLNSMVPLWQRKKSEVTKEEYDKFYQERYYQMVPPQSVVTVSAEGAVTYKALLFIPGAAPMDYYTKDYEKGLQLYSNGVLIMDKCADLLPEHFRFVRGVVDSPDLSLNISRELLQHDRQLKVIAGNLEKKIKAELLRMQKDDREGYEKFFRNFGRQLKYGVASDYGAHSELLQDLLLFYSSTEKKPVTLSEYVTRMPESQKDIYYAIGTDPQRIDKLPQIEELKEQGTEILYFTEEVDEFCAQVLRTYQEKPFRSAMSGAAGEDAQEKAKEAADAHKDVFAFVKETLGDAVQEVRPSAQLKSHPVCLTAGEGISFEMEKYFETVQPDAGIKAERILELNVEHPAFRALSDAVEHDPEKAKAYAQVLYNQALLIAGLPLEDPSAYTDLLCSLWQ